MNTLIQLYKTFFFKVILLSVLMVISVVSYGKGGGGGYDACATYNSAIKYYCSQYGATIKAYNNTLKSQAAASLLAKCTVGTASVPNPNSGGTKTCGASDYSAANSNATNGDGYHVTVGGYACAGQLTCTNMPTGVTAPTICMTNQDGSTNAHGTNCKCTDAKCIAMALQPAPTNPFLSIPSPPDISHYSGANWCGSKIVGICW